MSSQYSTRSASQFFIAALALVGCTSNDAGEERGETSGTSDATPVTSAGLPETSAGTTAAPADSSAGDDGESTSTTTAGDGSTSGVDAGSTDSGDGSSDGSSGGDASRDLRVFVTSTAFTGNMDGVFGADALCQASADSVGLGGTWRAWLGTSMAEPHEGIIGDGPWVDLEGTVIFLNRGGLLVDPLARIEFDERGEERFEEVWTGSSGENCANWTSETGLGGYGLTDDGAMAYDWTNRGDDSCDEEKHLYCFEAPR